MESQLILKLPEIVLVAGRRAGRQFRQMRRTKIPTQKSKPVNASYLHQWKPTPKVRMKHGSKRGQKLKF